VVRQVLAQTRARVLRGDTHYPHKIVSVFEPHTEILRKGKLAKPTEFGRLVKIQEAEAQFITDYQVCERGVSDRALWVPALDRHLALFGRPRSWRWPMAGLPRRRMNTRPACGMCGTSCCRDTPAPRAPALRAQPCAGAPAARGASVPSSGVMGCGAVGTADHLGCSVGSGWA
jgi:hypothetical protein